MRKLAAALVLLALLSGCALKSGSTPAPAPVVETPPPAVSPVPPNLPPVSSATPAPSDYTLAQQALRSGDYRGAADRLQKVVAADPQDAQAWSWLAFALARIERPSLPGRPGMHKPAVDAASRAVLLKPDLAGVQYTLGQALLADGQYKEALAPLSLALREQRNQERLTAYGLALIGAGQPEQALAVCREADKPNNEFRLARECLELLGDGFRRLNPAEAAIGDWLYEASKGFVWKGKPGAQGIPQTLNVSPPWTCVYAYPSEYWEYVLGCGGDGIYAWSAHSVKAGPTPSGLTFGMPESKVTELLGSQTYRSNRGLHYAVGDLHLVVYLSNQGTVAQLRFERPLPIFAVDKLLRGETGPPALQTVDGKLAGVSYGMTEPEVEKLLGASTGGPNSTEYSEERVYLGGAVRVWYAKARPNPVIRIDVLGGEHKTTRGIAVGSLASEVKRLYGVPREQNGAYVYAFGFERQATPLEFVFQIQDGKVARITVQSGPK